MQQFSVNVIGDLHAYEYVELLLNHNKLCAYNDQIFKILLNNSHESTPA